MTVTNPMPQGSMERLRVNFDVEKALADELRSRIFLPGIVARADR